MTNATFLYNNLWDAATLTYASQSPLFPASNTQQRHPTRTYRSTGVSAEWVEANLGGAYSWQAFVFKKHNLTSGATLKIQANTSSSWGGSLPVDVTLAPITADLMMYFWSSVRTEQYVRWTVADAGNTDGYIECGRNFLGPYFSPVINLSNDYDTGFDDPSDIMFSDGGQIVTNQKTHFQTVDLIFEYISAADLALFKAMFASRGLGREFFFTRDRDLAVTTTIYARFSAKPSAKHVFQETYYNVKLSIEELR